ncbi:MAG: FAD-binding oxidoreductase [Deltaproteobacteria bacterium]|nr:FAD-binding oxidoreductase [Deltaproteobacteria bacterium]
MAGGPDAIIIGAGILGLATAYHILQGNCALNLLILERLKGPGRANTAKSAAAYRDMFSSPVNRHLSRGSIAFYEEVQAQGVPIGLKRLGYLWLLTAAQRERQRQPLNAMARAGVKFAILELPELTRRLPELRPGDISAGIWGRNCGILNPNQLCGYYEREIQSRGGRFEYGREVTGFLRDPSGRIRGVRVGDHEIPAPTVIVATGAWLGQTLARAGLEAPVVPRKRQLFAISAREGPLRRLLETPGFNDYNLLPFTIIPGGAYLRPAPASFILGFANEDQPPGLEDQPVAEEDFFENRIRPQIEPYFPAFQGRAPEYAWAGHYADHLADRTPLVDRLEGAIVVGGDSGSGIMKADSLGRIAAARFFGKDQVELGDGENFQVTALGLRERAVPQEDFVI